jgi:glycosyltransferase involved in cell wall biosynthesis
MKISALLIARNEENKIRECLKNLSFVDELIIVLDRSTDKTKSIAKSFSDKIYEGKWEYEGDRRNFGISKCSNNWILEIDADEIVTLDLSKEIKTKISLVEYDFFYIKVLNFVQGQPVNNGWMSCLAPDGKFCLFKKESKIWENQRVHPNYSINGKKGTQLKNHIEHKMSENISDLFLRFNRNTDLKASDLVESKSSLKSYFSIRKVFSRFLKCFIKRKGYKEGIIGLLISVLCGLYLLVSAIKAETLKKETE